MAAEKQSITCSGEEEEHKEVRGREANTLSATNGTRRSILWQLRARYPPGSLDTGLTPDGERRHEEQQRTRPSSCHDLHDEAFAIS